MIKIFSSLTVLTLTGAIGVCANALAEEKARSSDLRVDERLVTRPGPVPEVQVDRPIPVVVDDATITAKVKAALLSGERVNARQVNVTTQNGMVTLTGDVPTQQDVWDVAKVAQKVEGVRGVVNQLRVAGTPLDQKTAAPGAKPQPGGAQQGAAGPALVDVTTADSKTGRANPAIVAFDILDRNGDGQVTREEVSPTKPHIVQAFERADKDRDSKLDHGEFMGFFIALQGAGATSQTAPSGSGAQAGGGLSSGELEYSDPAVIAFKKFDLNNDGRVTLEEVSPANQRVREAFAKADQGGDSSEPPGEAHRTVSSAPNDNVLTRSEFFSFYRSFDYRTRRELEGRPELTSGATADTAARSPGAEPTGVAPEERVTAVHPETGRIATGRPGAGSFPSSVNPGQDEDRTSGQFFEDAWITMKTKAALLANDQVKGTSIDVDTRSNIVTLHGTVQSQESAALARQIASTIEGVKSVNSNLTVARAGDVGRQGEGATGRRGVGVPTQ